MEINNPIRLARKFIRIHLDIPTIVLVSVVVLFVYRPLAAWLFSLVGWVESEVQFPAWVGSVAQGIVANLVSAAVIVPIAIWILRIRSKAAAAGRFKAFDMTSGSAESWGEVFLSYNLFSTKIRGTLTHNDIVMRLEAVLDKDQYLRGHYSEQSNVARRRLGAFLLLLNGEGDGYRGPFVFVDPADESATPKTGSVEWKRVSE